MARTKNTTKIDRAKAKHKPRVAKASLVKKTAGRKYQRQRGEGVDFKDVTHKVYAGKYKGCKGKILSKDEEGNAVFLVLINARGNPMRVPMEITLTENKLQDVNSDDMLSFIDTEGQEEEDPSTLAHDKEEWTCNECGGTNTNEGSFCNNVLGGEKVCGAVKPFEGKIQGWGNLFKVEKWICCVCTSPNDSSAIQCSTCAAHKDKEGSSPKDVLSSIAEEPTKNDSVSSADDEKIASLSAEVKNYSISGTGKGKRRKLDDSP